jgi:AraC-like DNA-binding protein
MEQDITLQEKIKHGTKEQPINGLHFSITQDPAADSFLVERHWHHYIEILSVSEGIYDIEINLSHDTLQEGDICILNSGDLHQIISDSPKICHDAVLFDPLILDFSYEDEFQTECIQPLLDQMLLLPAIFHKSHPIYPSIKSKVLELSKLTTTKPDRWYYQSKLLILELIFILYENGELIPAKNVRSSSEKRKIRHYKAVISYIEKNYHQPITLQDLSDTIPCNSQYLCRFFKDIAGISPIQYLIRFRLDRACYLLQHTSKPILEIAFDCGFENVSYFIRKFKEVNGSTPREYRLKLSSFEKNKI